VTVRPTEPTASSTVHVGRQPVYDRLGDVIGYELLFREAAHATSASRRNADATSQVIINAFTEFGLEELVGDRPCFVNLTREFLVGDLPVPFDYGQTVLEVLETVDVDDEVYAGIGNLVERGYTIALDDFVWTDRTARLLPLAHFVKIDMLDTDPDVLRDTVRRCRQYPKLSLVAERLETEEQLALAVELGFDCFQGHILGRPHVMTTQSLSPSKLSRLELLTALTSSDADVDRVTRLVTADPALSVRLLRATNSAASGLTQTVTSIHDAVVVLGLNRIRDWVTLMVISDISQASQDQLATTLIRARMCHTVADRRGLSPEAAFTVGLLSAVAELIAQPVTALAQNLPLAPDVSTALGRREGPLGHVLSTVRAYEDSDLDALGALEAPTDVDELASVYLTALVWSTRTMTPLNAGHGSTA
jgi:EAL and modified HD-GYP domain-containing signal transduction protein